MKYLSLLLLISFLPLDACTDKQLRDSRIAEQLYIELLEALHEQDLAAATTAATDLRIQLDNMNTAWRRPLSKQALEDCRYHLDQGRAAYGDMLAALAAKKISLARIQLDRATYELSVADPAAFQRLYMGKIYPFFSNWHEVNKIINDQMLCLMEWTEYAWWANTALAAWEEDASCFSPETRIYDWNAEQYQRFQDAQTQLSTAIARFKKTIPQGEQEASQLAAAEVNKTLWQLLSLLKAAPGERILAN